MLNIKSKLTSLVTLITFSSQCVFAETTLRIFMFFFLNYVKPLPCLIAAISLHMRHESTSVPEYLLGVCNS